MTTWRIIPVSNWLVTSISHSGHLEGEQPYLGDLLTMVIIHLLTGMILQEFTAWATVSLHHFQQMKSFFVPWDVQGLSKPTHQYNQYIENRYHILVYQICQVSFHRCCSGIPEGPNRLLRMVSFNLKYYPFRRWLNTCFPSSVNETIDS